MLSEKMSSTFWTGRSALPLKKKSPLQKGALRSSGRRRVLNLVFPVGSLAVLLLKTGFSVKSEARPWLWNGKFPGGEDSSSPQFVGGLLT